MTTIRKRTRDLRRGGALVEMALVLPLLFLIAMGAADFGRLFIHSIVVTNGAGAGSFYGAKDNFRSGDSAGIQAAAVKDTQDAGTVSTEATRLCDCPDAPKAWVSCFTASCASYGRPRAYVRTRVRQNFSTIGRYPGIPETVDVDKYVYVRVQ